MMQTTYVRWRVCAVLFGILMFVISESGQAQNWPRFRGEHGRGVSEQKGLPGTWDEGDYAWKIELPGTGHAAPIIWDDKLFVTSGSSDGKLRHLFCLDAVTGREIWSRSIGMTSNRKHAKNSYASSTPVTDGESVFVAFADEERFLLSAYDFQGRLVWRRNLGPFTNRHGLGASPIIFDRTVIMVHDHTGPSTVRAFDKQTGQIVWSTLRNFRRTAHATPLIIQDADKAPQLICLSGATGLSNLDPFTGIVNWETGELPDRTIASPIYAGGLLFATCGRAGRGALLIAVDPHGKSDGSPWYVKYQRNRALPYVPTIVEWENHIYLWGDNGVVSCVVTPTGENVWTKRIDGKFSGSPLVIDGKIYCISEDGNIVVIDASPTFRLYGGSALGDNSHSTPSVAHGRLYLRGFHVLACLDSAL